MSSGAETDSPSIPPPVLGDGRTRRVAITWLAGLAYTFTTIVIGFLATPWLVAMLGEDRIGAHRASIDWLGYLGVLELGVGSAIGVYMLRGWQGQGPTWVSHLTFQGVRILGRLLVPMLLVGVPLAWWMPSLVTVPEHLRTELRWASLLSLLGLVMVPLGPFRSVLETAQRGYWVHLALAAQSLAITGLSLLFAWMGHGLLGLVGATLLGSAIFHAMTIVLALRLLGDTTGTVAGRMTLRTIWPQCWPLALAGLANRFGAMTDAILVGWFLGVGPVAAMFLTQRLIAMASVQMNSISSASWAALADLRHRAPTAFATRLGDLTSLVMGASLALVGTVAAYNERFVALWVGSELYAGSWVSLLTLANGVVFASVLLFRFLIDSQADARHRLPSSLICGVLTVVLGAALATPWGIAGVLAGKLIAFVLTDFIYCPWLVHRRYQVPRGVLLSAMLRGAIAGGAWAGTVWQVARLHLSPPGLAAFLAEFSLMGMASLAFLTITVLSKPDRKRVLAVVKGPFTWRTVR